MNGQPTWQQGSLWLNAWRKGREVRPNLLEPGALQVGDTVLLLTAADLEAAPAAAQQQKHQQQQQHSSSSTSSTSSTASALRGVPRHSQVLIEG
jgi:hypothetical protein